MIRRIIAYMAVAAIGVFIAAAAPAAAATLPTPVPHPTPAERVHEILSSKGPATANITPPPRGATILKKQHDAAVAKGAVGVITQKYVPYKPTNNTSAATSSAPSTIQPNSYPYGCGLFITEYFRAGPRQIEADSLTDCDSAVAEINQYIGTAVDTGFGLAQINSDNNEVFNTSFDTLNLFTSCASYPGPYYWESAVSGDVFQYGGGEFTADAYDSLDGVRC